jgi:phage I-like protein
MTLHDATLATTIVELNFSTDGAVPDAIELLPRGPRFVGRDGREFVVPDPDALAAAFNAANQPVVIDIDHASEEARPGTIVPAVGWVDRLEVRDGAIWGHVRWSDLGRELMAQQAYRFVSPALIVNRVSRVVARLTSVGLVHKPNLALQALNSEENEQMDTAILEALGLKADATTADAVVAINRMKEAQETALNSAKHPDPEKFVPRADYDLVLNKAETAENELNAVKEAELNKTIESTVDELIEGGFISPASREDQIEICRDAGVEKFKRAWANQPRVLASGKTTPTKKPETDRSMSADERAARLEVCRMFGTDPETHMAFAAKEKEA